MREPLRATTSPTSFEDHPGSAELWSPRSPLFPAPEDAGAEVPLGEARRLIDLLSKVTAG